MSYERTDTTTERMAAVLRVLRSQPAKWVSVQEIAAEIPVGTAKNLKAHRERYRYAAYCLVEEGRAKQLMGLFRAVDLDEAVPEEEVPETITLPPEEEVPEFIPDNLVEYVCLDCKSRRIERRTYTSTLVNEETS